MYSINVNVARLPGALQKLRAVSEAVNVRLADADSNKKLMELHRKLEGVFDVFAPSRRLVHDARILKQSRRELQERHLVLVGARNAHCTRCSQFTDYLLICRDSMGFDSFDAQRVYRIPVSQVRVSVEEHEDYEREFAIINPKKSNVFLCKSKAERDLWVRRITETAAEFRCARTQRRVSAAAGSVTTSSAESARVADALRRQPLQRHHAHRRGAAQA